MQKPTYSTTLTAPTRLHSTSNNVQPKSDPNWKPEPCGLSREELRRIVAEIMG